MNREERLNKMRRQNQATFAKAPPAVPLVLPTGPCEIASAHTPGVPQKAPRTAQKPPEQRKAVYQRLPAGAKKTLIWNGEAWYGRLEIEGCPEFHFQAASEAKCFHGLHNEYTKWLKENQQ